MRISVNDLEYCTSVAILPEAESAYASLANLFRE